MSLEVLDFTTRKKLYKLEAGEFALKPPYMNIVGQTETLIKEMIEFFNISKNQGNTSSNNFEQIIKIQLRLLRLLLEETDKGKLSDLSAENLRQDVLEVIVNDFFCQFKK